jgi:NAD(P)-dependent dehydrogenase (short-subunit alcohol dehydrogenase family)
MDKFYRAVRPGRGRRETQELAAWAPGSRLTPKNPFGQLCIYVGIMANVKKIALITGANRGLGFEMARQLGKAGVTVLLAARNPRKGEAAAEKLRGEGLDAQFLKLDVTDKADHTAASTFLEEKFGRLNILINNAGISADGMGGGKVSTTTEEAVRRTFETNFFAPVALTRVLLPLLMRSAAGRIVNMSSILGSQTLHADAKSPIYDFKSLSYDASKAALNSFTIHLAYELKDTKIKVNSAHPGWVKTDMGTDAAPLEIPEGARTGVELALLGEDGPTGGFFHLGKPIPW